MWVLIKFDIILIYYFNVILFLAAPKFAEISKMLISILLNKLRRFAYQMVYPCILIGNKYNDYYQYMHIGLSLTSNEWMKSIVKLRYILLILKPRMINDKTERFPYIIMNFRRRFHYRYQTNTLWLDQEKTPLNRSQSKKSW